MGLRATLVLDTFRCHLDQRVKDNLTMCNTNLVIISGGITLQLLPLNVCFKKPLKDKSRTHYIDWLINGRHKFTRSNGMKHASLEDLTKRVKDAWCAISLAMVIKAFKKCSILNAIDGTNNEMLWATESDKEWFNSDDD